MWQSRVSGLRLLGLLLEASLWRAVAAAADSEGAAPAPSPARLRGKAPLPGVQCRTASPGDACFEAVVWAMERGVRENASWFPAELLQANATFEDFQALFYRGGEGPSRKWEPMHNGCSLPCPAPRASAEVVAVKPENASAAMSLVMENTSAAKALMVDAGAGQDVKLQASTAVLGWHPTAEMAGGWNNWCRVEVPAADFSLQQCNAGGPKMQIKVLTYNLFWWNLFGRRGGNGGSAGHLIQRTGMPMPYDVMGFQECDDVGRVLSDGGLFGDYGYIQGQYSLGIAYRKGAWAVMADGTQDVAEDQPSQWYGNRGGQWARLRHLGTGKVVFFVNHHGPLPLHTGGKCGGRATAYNLLKLIALRAGPDDAIVMVGDFNAGHGTETVQSLGTRMHRVFSGNVFGGIDHIFSNCGGPHVISTNDLGDGGSDHHALNAVIEV